jgi:2-keto-4-pentenoate hydratase/2-oxohepta-3-ene-1,7-dioic acid hydratase in catechol pathway
MRYLTYRRSGINRLGSLQQGYIVDVEQVAGVGDLLSLIKGGVDLWDTVATKLKSANLDELKAKGAAVLYHEGLVAAPYTNPPKNVICLGRNYYKHYLEGAVARGESGEKPPEAPIYFTKPPTSITGAFDPIPLDLELTQKLDWEVEFGVIIGVGGKKISHENALKHVFGYTIINDLSARDLQYKHQQWFKGKGLDGSCPFGPFVVTPDELPESLHLPISLNVNGITKQDANTGQLMFDIPTIIADLSTTMTLEPGDIISTGTPDGVGNFRNPPEYLAHRDVMETIIEGIGTMRHRIASPERVALVAAFDRARDELLKTLSLLQPQHYDLATVNLGWSVKELVAHLAGGITFASTAIQRHLDGTLVAGLQAMNERNASQVEERAAKSLQELVDELVQSHYQVTDLYLSLTDEQTQITSTMSSGAKVNIHERLQRYTNHYMEHANEIFQAINA